MAPTPKVSSADLFLKQLEAVPFIRRVSFTPAGKGTKRSDGVLTLRTEQGTYNLKAEFKLSYLDRASTHALSSHAAVSQREGHSLILLARYIPRPTGEQLIAASVNFVDLAGNIHVALGNRYRHTLLGRTETPKHHAKRPATAAQVQLLFLFAAKPEALNGSVRQMATEAGVSKSKAATVRQQLIEKGTLSMAKGQPWAPRQLEPLLVSGYAEVLRPKLLLGRFRAPEAKSVEFLARVSASLASKGVRFSLTGGLAADLLQQFYRGPEIPLFINQWNPELQKQLRLLPDRQGPVMVMRAFGEPVFWRTIGNVTVAHPWLIYAELMNSDDPRAHEAAEELRHEYRSR